MLWHNVFLGDISIEYVMPQSVFVRESKCEMGLDIQRLFEMYVRESLSAFYASTITGGAVLDRRKVLIKSYYIW